MRVNATKKQIQVFCMEEHGLLMSLPKVTTFYVNVTNRGRQSKSITTLSH